MLKSSTKRLLANAAGRRKAMASSGYSNLGQARRQTAAALRPKGVQSVLRSAAKMGTLKTTF